MRKKKKIYADAYECDEGSPVVVEIQYDKGEAMLCFGRDGMAEYTLRAGSAGDILHVLVNAEKGIAYYWNVHEPNYNTLTNFEVNSVADYAGKKIRALGVWGDYYAAIGASPVNIPGTEVYQALQLGTIDGAHYGWSALSDANNIREVTKYAIHPSLCYCQMATLVSENSLNALPEDLRNAVDIALEEANMGSVSLAHIAETEQSVRAAVNGGYIEIVDLPDEVVAELREIAVTQVWEALAAKSDRMAKGIEIIKQQSRDYGRQVDY